MKKLLIIILVLSLAGVAAVLTGFKIRTSKPQPVALLDSATVFDLQKVRQLKPNAARLAEATRLYLLAERETDDDMRAQNYLLSLRTFPMSDVYRNYSYSRQAQNRYDPAVAGMQILADSISGMIEPGQFFTAAKYALGQKDTSSSMLLLSWYMGGDSLGYRVVDHDEMFRALDNYPSYYYMMDDYVQQDSALGYQSTLRTLRFTNPSPVPFTVSIDVINKTYEYKLDSATGNYTNPYALRDDAMRDLVSGNRYGRFGRETDHSVQHVATLHLSDKFFTYVYSQQNWRNKMMEDVLELPAADSASAEDKEMPVQAKPYPSKESPEVYNGANKIYIVNIDKYGKKISEQQIACKCSPMHVSTAVIDKNGQIEVHDLEQKWKNDPLTAGYEKNEVVRRDVTAITRYKVKTNGEIIVAVSEGATAKAQ
ncbi:MAG: hypothetical protein JWO03_3250 [Bacteroidetes bacterium]|nr:hypothetical protein [Bacteroidota bacterium]